MTRSSLVIVKLSPHAIGFEAADQCIDQCPAGRTYSPAIVSSWERGFAPDHYIWIRWLLRFVGNGAAAEDLLSEVFLDVWRQADRFEGRSSVSTWLISIARFKALSAGRRRTDTALDEMIEATIAGPTNDPEVSLQEKDRGELVRQARIQLSRAHRQIIDLVYYHEARRLARGAVDSAERADLLEVEQGWLALARSHEPEPIKSKRQGRVSDIKKVGSGSR